MHRSLLSGLINERAISKPKNHTNTDQWEHMETCFSDSWHYHGRCSAVTQHIGRFYNESILNLAMHQASRVGVPSIGVDLCFPWCQRRVPFYHKIHIERSLTLEGEDLQDSTHIPVCCRAYNYIAVSRGNSRRGKGGA